MTPILAAAPAVEHFGFPLEAIAIFVVVVAVAVWLDLFAHRKAHDISIRDASLWSLFWVGLAVGWYGYLRFRYSPEAADLFLAGYALEKSLSIDNMMVFIAIFSSFSIRGVLQHRVLYYGILGAIVFRFIFIALGTSLLLVSHWVLFLFAAVVLWSAWKMWTADDHVEVIEDYSQHFSVQWARRLFAVFPRLEGERFFLSRAEVEERRAADPTLQVEDTGKSWYATPMFLCLIVIEASDLVFAFDSVPAVIAVTQEPLLVYTSIMFAILGLRSLYFVLAALTQYLRYLETAVILLLVYIGLKLGAEASHTVFGTPEPPITPGWNVVVVLGVLALGIVASLVLPDRSADDAEEEPKHPAA